MDRAFVAGATGYTGYAVVKALGERGIPTIAHVRPDSPRTEEWGQRFQELGAQFDWTPWDEPALTDMLARHRPTIIFSLLGTTKKRMKELTERGGDPRLADYEAVDYGLTAMLVNAVMAAGIVPRFMYLSAIGVGAHARGGYYRARWRIETKLRESGLPYTIARPSFITGLDREEPRPTEHLAAGALNLMAAGAGRLGFSRFRERYLSLTGPELARALVNLALDPNAALQIYETDLLRKYASR